MFKNPVFGSLYAIDDLGRRLPDERYTGSEKPDHVVGMFYFLTHGAHRPTQAPTNIDQLKREHPEALMDYDSPAWGKGSLYWDEPLFGYYFQTDKWVLRRHVKLLTQAGIDFLIFDTTNRVTFFPHVRALLEVLDDYRKEGWNVPKIVYYTNTQSGETVNEIWHDVYEPGLFPELWFQWEGKPLIIADPQQCTIQQREFFTFRLPQWPTEAKKEQGCPWIDFVRPQRVWKNAKGDNEIVPVSVAQHPNLSFGDGAFYNDPVPRGRSFHDGRNDKTEGALKYGYNVAEQWERALELDPQMVFFTGWNEWTVGRIRGDDPRPVLLVDQADAEYSRDVEPMKGGFFDNYYMQLCDYVRRYKGSPKLPSPSPFHKLSLSDSFSQWEDPSIATFEAMPFGTLPRNAEGQGGIIYSDNSGRNEFSCLKVAHDEENVYFYARTRDKIEFNMFTKWMTLYIGVQGREYEPSWQGYQYIVNDIVLDRSATFFQTCLGGYRFGNNIRIDYRMQDNELMIRIPRILMKLKPGPFELYFKWADHTGKNESVADFYCYGDTAPYGRFSYIYRAE